MADDERRADIEAVARWLDEGGIDRLYGLGPHPRDERRLRKMAAELADRVRDARRDDEVERLRRQRNDEFNRHSQTLLRLEAAEAARSPQGEDHEAGIEAAARAFCGHPMFYGDATYGDGERIARLMAPYLSRVSPSRDGSVAVEDVRAQTIAEVVAWLSRPGANPGMHPFHIAAQAIERRFSPASTGDQAPEATS